MKTTQITKGRVWRRCVQSLEIWECVPLRTMTQFDVTPLAYVSEHVRVADGTSFFIYEVGNETGWELRRREAMKKAEGILERRK